jgi:hypothetical protein
MMNSSRLAADFAGLGAGLVCFVALAGLGAVFGALADLACLPAGLLFIFN